MGIKMKIVYILICLIVSTMTWEIFQMRSDNCQSEIVYYSARKFQQCQPTACYCWNNKCFEIKCQNRIPKFPPSISGIIFYNDRHCYNPYFLIGYSNTCVQFHHESILTSCNLTHLTLHHCPNLSCSFPLLSGTYPRKCQSYQHNFSHKALCNKYP